MHKVKSRNTSSYSFPVQFDGSAFFAFSGAVVEKAVLEANQNVLSVYRPAWSEQEADYPESVEVPITDINFFGAAPFHAALAAEWFVRIVLYTQDSRLPSLTIKPADKSVTWSTADGDIYTEDVTVNSENGPRNLTIVYTPNTGGYMKK